MRTEAVLSQAGVHPLHTEGLDNGNWAVLDYASVIVHIFDKPSREFYNLEKLWRDATAVNIED